MTVAKSIQELREFYNYFFHRYEGRTKVWYRGESSTTYSLTPSLHRTMPKGCPHWLIVEKEREALEIFKKAQPEIANELTDWEIFFYMQHYGVKTRFLDWTESARISLFFAFSGWNLENGNCKMWFLDPCMLNLLSLGIRGVQAPKNGKFFVDYLTVGNEIDHTVALYPPTLDPLFNERIKVQKGCFTMHYGYNTATSSLNDLANEIGFLVHTKIHVPDDQFDFNLKEEDVLDCIEIHTNMYEEVESYLSEMGITYKEIYPDIEG
ncbi:FRG domain-containing protein [Heyndrickxia ginsengihumi]|uniref:FRG domain-containing protein n=1 Tax=Heyndrickxia ginsengihumi TaxID=363870 RepID=UPI00068B3624|nr:FRG domain-containing protein [Heyndrickxia ginsengihumi]